MSGSASHRAKLLTCLFKSGKWKARIIRWYIMWRVSYDVAERDAIYAKQMAGYVPDPEEVFATRKGTCWDYAALYQTMLQAVGIEANVVMGHCTALNGYHAWNEVNIAGTWRIVDIARDGKCYFSRMYKDQKEYKRGD